jgi:carboxymethylenebutenolidase
MIEFEADGRTISGYLSVPENGKGPGVLVLHAWWGLTDFFKQVCERLATEGFIALAPDLYHGKTTTTIDEARQLSSGLVDSGETYQNITESIKYLFKHPGRQGKTLGAVGFSLGGYWALGLEDLMAAIVTFYGTTGPENVVARAEFLGHFAEHDDVFNPLEDVRRLEEDIRSSGREASFYIYPGTRHWFFEENRPEYDAEAARLAWERTIEFLHERLD